jgi:ribosome maturation factor RimP
MAADVLSGPGVLASRLRQSQLAGLGASASLPLDVPLPLDAGEAGPVIPAHLRRALPVNFQQHVVTVVDLIGRVRALAERVAGSYDLEVFDVRYRRESSGMVLRVQVDRQGPSSTAEESVSVDDCARVSNHLTRLFAVENIEYERLEVSSPGFDRILRTRAHFDRFLGERIFAELKLPIDGRRRYVGRLKSIEGDTIVMEVDGKAHNLPLERIQKARLRPE